MSEVGDGGLRGADFGLDLLQLGFVGRDGFLEFLAAGDEGGALVFGGLGDAGGGVVLFLAEGVAVDDEGAAAIGEGDEGGDVAVDAAVAAVLGDFVGVVANVLEVEHCRSERKKFSTRRRGGAKTRKGRRR